MIKRGSFLNIADNSGARLVQCIGFFKSIKCNSVGINDIIRICIKKLNRKKFYLPKGKGKTKIVKKIRIDSVTEKEKLVYRAVILSCKKPWYRTDGTFVSSKKNRAIIISDNWKFMGTRLIGPITKELRKKKRIPIFKELISYAKRRV